uniref:Ig-like domain-containing protein n=1 Tax=Oncorhynchus kisutch TaxID=8019 RepID=A0A8C7JIA6_ONCKI
MVVKPRESWSITCKVSGYSICDESNTTDWIRHPVDKAIEWFSISKNGSNNIVTLEGKRIQTEDTARVVFVLLGICPCHTVYGYFDYWGKGTMVTVSSATTAPSSLFPLMNCGTPTNDIYSIGCVATGFSPSSITFKWTDSSESPLTDFVQYPSVQSGGAYIGVSQLRVSKNEWGKSEYFRCSVEHPGGKKTTVINKQPGKIWSLYCFFFLISNMACFLSLLSHCFSPFSEPLTVTLNPPSVKKVFLDNQAVLDCVIAGTDQNTVAGTTITWQVNGKDETEKIVESKDNLNSRVSTLTIDQTRWTNVNKVHVTFLLKIKPLVGRAPSVSVHLLPEEDTKKEGDVTLVCLVVSPSLCDVYIMWKEDRSEYQDGVTSPPQKTPEGNYSVTSVFTIKKNKWEGNSVFTCAVKHGLDNNTLQRVSPVTLYDVFIVVLVELKLTC